MIIINHKSIRIMFLLCNAATASIILIAIRWKNWSLGPALSHWGFSSKWTLSAVNIDHLSVNKCTLPAIKPKDPLFEHQIRGPLRSSDWVVNPVMEESHDDMNGCGSHPAQPWLPSPPSLLSTTICWRTGRHVFQKWNTRKHHWYIQIQIFLSLLAWQKFVRYVDPNTCSHYVQIIRGKNCLLLNPCPPFFSQWVRPD